MCHKVFFTYILNYVETQTQKIDGSFHNFFYDTRIRMTKKCYIKTHYFLGYLKSSLVQ